MHGLRRKRHIQASCEQKLYAVQEVLLEKRSRKDIATELNVSVNSITTWIKIYKEYGENGFTSVAQYEIKRLKEIEKNYYKLININTQDVT
ncbi:helix-turn-helix domain-containing protein [Psychrobacillus sp. NEAU-3TGS]|uniref:helix-turn-helix domain-containing protein n=1 Tax=Psychrobacillus sp. NEAU-3TGS TaxID=2995412 RepID=UPI00249839CC|nr:helix-turn-helix domain-containing protein [Psychrobacillus sp. NEAU-3TGS]MDI2587622.1 helix-turn-helix domain-containing protein [Psychrobacillus sp. NEAU-3TGS]